MNGKPLSGISQQKVQPAESITRGQENIANTHEFISVEPIKNVIELIEYLDKSESAIRIAIQDMAIADITIQEYRELASRTDAEHYFALVAPISK